MIIKQSIFKEQAKLAVQLADEAMREKVAVIPTIKLAQDLHAQGKVIVHKPKTSYQLEIEGKADELLDAWLYDDECDGLNDALCMNLQLVKTLLQASPKDLADARTDLLMAVESYAKKNRDFMSDAKDWYSSNLGTTKQVSDSEYSFEAHAQC
jgi:hypothetical protein